MAKLIRQEPEDKFNEERYYWLVAERFEVIVYMGNSNSSFFISDKKNEMNSSELTIKIANELQLYDEEVKIIPSIDTCGITVPKSHNDRIFKFIENYLLELIK